MVDNTIVVFSCSVLTVGFEVTFHCTTVGCGYTKTLIQSPRMRHEYFVWLANVTADVVLRRGSHVQVMEDIQELLRREHCQLFLVIRLLWENIITPIQGAFVSVKLFPVHPSVRRCAASRAAPSVVPAQCSSYISCGATGLPFAL